MAPNLATAEATYSQAVKKLKVACTFLEGQLSPPEPGEVIDIPTDRPEARANIAQTCGYCEQELEQIEPDQRVDHECTHQEQLNQEAAASRQYFLGRQINLGLQHSRLRLFVSWLARYRRYWLAGLRAILLNLELYFSSDNLQILA